MSACVSVCQRVSASFIDEVRQRIFTGQDQAGPAVHKKQVAAETHYSELKLKAEHRYLAEGHFRPKVIQDVDGSIDRQQPRFNFKLKIGVRVKILILAIG
jgi:hypothetical protein